PARHPDMAKGRHIASDAAEAPPDRRRANSARTTRLCALPQGEWADRRLSLRSACPARMALQASAQRTLHLPQEHNTVQSRPRDEGAQELRLECPEQYRGRRR